MNRCELYEQWLSAQLDGQLTEQEQQQLQAHLDQCPQCRALQQQLEQVHEYTTRLGQTPPPDGFSQSVLSRLHAPAQKRRLVPLPLRAFAAAAACAAICLGVAYQQGAFAPLFAGSSGSDALQSEVAAPFSADVSTDELAQNGLTGAPPSVGAVTAESGSADLPAASTDYAPRLQSLSAQPVDFSAPVLLPLPDGAEQSLPESQLIHTPRQLTDALSAFPDAAQSCTHGWNEADGPLLLLCLTAQEADRLPLEITLDGDTLSVTLSRGQTQPEGAGAWLLAVPLSQSVDEGVALAIRNID